MTVIWGYLGNDGALHPYQRWADRLGNVRSGDRLRIVVEKDRNGKFNSLYHLMLSKCVDAINAGPIPTETDIPKLKRWVKKETGRYDVIRKPGEEPFIDYHSTDYASMGDDEFIIFARDTCDLIRERLAPWISQSPQWPEIENMLCSIQPAEAA